MVKGVIPPPEGTREPTSLPVDLSQGPPRTPTEEESSDKPAQLTPSVGFAKTLPSSKRRAAFKRGDSLGRYVVLEELGSGGMGVVYAAYDPELDRKVALKLLHGHLADFPDSRARLQREAQAMARLTHPNVVSVYDVGTFDEKIFVAMEFVDGRTLSEWLREKPRPWREILLAFRQAGMGLAAAHAASLVHRDFKPSNVLVRRDEAVKVSDFGLALSYSSAARDFELPTNSASAGDGQATLEGGEAPQSSPSAGTPGFSQSIGRSGESADSTPLAGTPGYMAPEQLRGETIDARADQYSFCVTFYEALLGERPFEGKTLATVRSELAFEARAAHDPKRKLAKDAKVPTWVLRPILRGLAPNPADRFETMGALLKALDAEPRSPWRRALAFAALATLVVGTVAGYRTAVQRHSQICKGAERQLAGVWDPERKRAVSAAFMATAKPYAADAIRGVEQAFDAYAQGWVAMHTDACAATRLRGEQSEELLDLRMQCLSERREELKSLADIFSRRDPKVVERAVQAAFGLTSLEGCANAAALRAPVKPAADPATRAKADELRGKLAQVGAFLAAGKFTEGLPIAKAAVAEAKAVQYRPIEAEALYRLGALQNRAGDYKTAEQTLHDAVFAAEAGRHDEILAQAWVHLVAVGYDQAQYARSHEAAQYAFAALERFGGGDQLRARLFNHLGLVLEREGKYAEALEHHQRALEMWERALGPEHPDVALSLNNSAIVLKQLGQYDRAVEHYRRALAITEKALGADHPSNGRSLMNLASVFVLQGNYEQALAYDQRTLALYEKAYGPEHPWVADALNNAGGVLAILGKRDQALVYQERALEIRKHTIGPAHPEVATSLQNIAYLLSAQGKYDEAITQARSSLDIRERALGPNHAMVARSLKLIGTVLERQGKYGDALVYYQRALTINESAFGATHSEVADSINLIAGPLRFQGKYSEALADHERALGIWEKTLGPKNPQLAFSLTGIGETYLAMRMPDRAVAPLERALSLRESQPGEPVWVAATRFALARALNGTRQDIGRARELARQARETYAGAGMAYKRELVKVDTWLSSKR